MRVSTRRIHLSPLLAVCIVALTACSGDYPQTTFRPVSEFGRVLNSLFANTFWWTIGVLLLVEGLIVYSMIHYRARPGQPKPKQTHGNVKLEFLWTLIPGVIVLFIAIPTIQVTFTTQRQPPADALRVEVIGHQWWWEFRYPEYGVTTANELYLPAGRPISLKMYSADVIHSFWVPRVGGKRDVNPRPRTHEGEREPPANYLTFAVDSAGYFLGQCAEFCGASHAIMRTAIVALPQTEFANWVTSMGGAQPSAPAVPAQPADTVRTDTSAAARAQADTAAAAPQRVATPGVTPTPPPSPLQGPATPPTPLTEEQRGQQLFLSKACIACHTIQGTSARGVLGPNLTRFGARRTIGAGARPNTLANVEAWIRHPAALKPGALMPGARAGAAGMPPTGLTDDEIRAIAAYLVSLK